MRGAVWVDGGCEWWCVWGDAASRGQGLGDAFEAGTDVGLAVDGSLHFGSPIREMAQSRS
jgi:hypothetical protein